MPQERETRRNGIGRNGRIRAAGLETAGGGPMCRGRPRLVERPAVATAGGRDARRSRWPAGKAIRPAPSAARTGRIIGVNPVRAGYRVSTARRRAPIAAGRTRLTVQPPNPAPVIRAAMTPGTSDAISTMASSSGELTSNRSRSEAWLAAKRRPTAARSPASSAATVSPTRMSSVTTCSARANATGSRRSRAAARRSGVTSRRLRIDGSSRASPATAASHWRRRVLYSEPPR